jgi:hypothetical protein
MGNRPVAVKGWAERHVSRGAMLAISLCAAFIAGSVLAPRADAGWEERTMPCGSAPWAISPAPLYWTAQAGQPAAAPEGFFGFPYEEHRSADEFTATASWGDGTTTAATVGISPILSCYIVSAARHTYASVGSYPFSYTVTDTKTGVTHTLAAKTLHIWSYLPYPIGDPSSRTIDATVGTPWSGTVAEFSYEGEIFTWDYQAQIYWGDGAGPQTGTIVPGSSYYTFAVTGSATFLMPFKGNVSVLLSHAGPLGTWATSAIDVTALVRHSTCNRAVHFSGRHGSGAVIVVYRGITCNEARGLAEGLIRGGARHGFRCKTNHKTHARGGQWRCVKGRKLVVVDFG